LKGARRKRSNLQQPSSRLLKLKEMNPILKALLYDRTVVADIENHLEETTLRWLWNLERMDKTNLVKRVREERFPGHMKRVTP